jgi:hypothetical protein
MADSRLLGRRSAVGLGVAVVLVMGLYACFPGMPLLAMPRQGRVVDAKTGKPVAGALVLLGYQILQGVGIHRAENLETRWTETDSEGRFRFGVKLFDDIGSRWAFRARTPSLIVYHKDYESGGASFDHQGYGLPFFEIPVRLKPFDEEEIRKLPLDPREHYRNPRHLVDFCSGRSEAACQHICEWLYGLPEDECVRLRGEM